MLSFKNLRTGNRNRYVRCEKIGCHFDSLITRGSAVKTACQQWSVLTALWIVVQWNKQALVNIWIFCVRSLLICFHSSTNSIMSMTGFTCNTCRVAFADADFQREHYRTDWHRYNLKRKVAEMSPVTLDNFNQRVQAQTAQVHHPHPHLLGKGGTQYSHVSYHENNYTPRFNEVERGVYWFHLVGLSVNGHNRVRSVFSTILIGSISCLHILSSNFRMCVVCNICFKIKKFEILANSLNL